MADQSLQPAGKKTRSLRKRLGLREELLLALLPALTILLVLALVEAISQQRLIFASLASSAFLIYLDPEHGTNTIRTLVISHVVAVVAGVLTYLVIAPGYSAAGMAMILTTVVMIVLDAVHPPAISTALGFAFREANETTLTLFLLALVVVVVLVVLEQALLWLLGRLARRYG